MDVFVNFKGFIEKVHSTIARGDHKLPFNFSWLDLEGSFKVDDGFLELILLGVVHT
jgi:hypothetical protein